MRFLADESCDFRVIRALRAAGHDVMSILEVAPGAEDGAVIAMAVRENRIFVTEDRDFGQLVYAAAQPAPGVIMLRFPSQARARLPSVVVETVSQLGDKLAERFVVIQPGKIRFGVIPRN